MPRLSTGLLVAGGLATLITVVIAWPVFLHPTQLIYGREIVGRHPDPYTLIQLLAGPTPWSAGVQVFTDGPAWLLARGVGAVAAYNALVLASFPLTAMAAYILTRQLTASHAAGLIAAMVFAFSPLRLAHAAYHPYLLQAEWLPLLVLALAAIVERRTARDLLVLAAVSAALALTSDNVAFIGLSMAVVVMLAFWSIRSDADRNPWPFLLATATFGAIAVTGSYLLSSLRPDLFDPSLERPMGDVAFYRARSWAYGVPAVDHPWFGSWAMDVFSNHGINLQLTELQLYLGYGWTTLAVAALIVTAWRWRRDERWRFVAAIAAIAVCAFVVSLGPTSGSCEPASLAPGCLLFRIAPAFPMYARFGLVVQLMMAVGAGTGAVLLARYVPSGKPVAVALVCLGIIEYLPLPARAHDVLPTTAHRWLATSDARRTLDCYPASAAQNTLPTLLGREITLLDSSIASCGDPQLGLKLAGLGYTHVVVRRSAAASKLPVPPPIGLSPVREFADATVYTIDATPPPVLTLSSEGFFGDEHDGDDWWRWMGTQGRWHVQNTTAEARTVTLSVNLVAVGVPRTLIVRVDDHPAVEVSVGTERRDYRLGPWTLAPGPHTVLLEASGDPIRAADVAGSGDTRPLTIAFRADRWITGDR